MNPNDNAPRDFNQPMEPNPNEFGTPMQPSTPENPTAADFSSNSEQTPPPTQPEPSTTPESQPFGQPTPPPTQPAFPSPGTQPIGQPPVGPAPTGENPGQTLGIVSIVLSVIGFSLIGLILGIISRKKSKEANAPTTLGTVGMVLGIVFTVVGFIISAFFLLTVLIGVQSIASESKDNNGSSNLYDSDTSSADLASQATTVAQKAEAFRTKAGDYPEYSFDFDKYPESTIDSDIDMYTAIVTNKNVTYLYCEPGAAQVVYYKDADGTELAITPLGTASSSASCVEIN